MAGRTAGKAKQQQQQDQTLKLDYPAMPNCVMGLVSVASILSL
jgi:hypothetical protein